MKGKWKKRIERSQKKEGKKKGREKKRGKKKKSKKRSQKEKKERKEKGKRRPPKKKRKNPNWHPSSTGGLVSSCHRQDSSRTRLLLSRIPPVNSSPPAIVKTLPWRTSCHRQDLALAHEPLELRLATHVAASSGMCPSWLRPSTKALDQSLITSRGN
jgi:hypothetical protein